MKTFVLVIIGLLLPVFTFTTSDGFVKRKEKSMILEVPTSGKIIEVNYRPEFDEWWVHCREGENIAVYSYDYKSQSWGKVLFTPKRADEKDKLKIPDRSKESAEMTVKPEPQPREDHQEAKPPERKEPAKEQRSEKRWWDPLNLLKGPEKKPN